MRYEGEGSTSLDAGILLPRGSMYPIIRSLLKGSIGVYRDIWGLGLGFRI